MIIPDSICDFLYMLKNMMDYYRVSLSYKFTCFFIYFLFLSEEEPMLEMLDFTVHIGSTPTFLYFDSYLNTAYVYFSLHVSL